MTWGFRLEWGRTRLWAQPWVSNLPPSLLTPSWESSILGAEGLRCRLITSLVLQDTPSFTVPRFIALHRCCLFLQMEEKTLHQQKRFQLILLLWSGTKLAVSPGRACNRNAP